MEVWRFHICQSLWQLQLQTKHQRGGQGGKTLQQDSTSNLLNLHASKFLRSSTFALSLFQTSKLQSLQTSEIHRITKHLGIDAVKHILKFAHGRTIGHAAQSISAGKRPKPLRNRFERRAIEKQNPTAILLRERVEARLDAKRRKHMAFDARRCLEVLKFGSLDV